MNDLFTVKHGRDGDLEQGNQRPIHSGVLGLEKNFDKVNEIEKDYKTLSSLLRKLQEESKSVTKTAVMKSIKQRIEKDVDQAENFAKSIFSKIEALEKENLATRKKPGCEEGSSVDRSRTTITMCMKKKFKDKMSKFQKLRGNISTWSDEETIDNLPETGNSEHILQYTIREQGRGLVLDTVAEIRERHVAVRDLETDLHDLHQVFLDMTVLVEHQSDLLDNIESHVSSAKEYMQSGNTSLQNARKLQKSSRKWMCICPWL